MDPTFVDSVVQLLQSGKYEALTALGIAYLVRLLQSDTKIPFDLPTKYRAPLEMVLALGSGVITKQVSGLTWKASLVWGGMTGLLLITGRTTITEVLGKEPAILVPLKPVTGVVGTGRDKIATPLEIPVSNKVPTAVESVDAITVETDSKADETTKP